MSHNFSMCVPLSLMERPFDVWMYLAVVTPEDYITKKCCIWIHMCRTKPIPLNHINFSFVFMDVIIRRNKVFVEKSRNNLKMMVINQTKLYECFVRLVATNSNAIPFCVCINRKRARTEAHWHPASSRLYMNFDKIRHICNYVLWKTC